jgi:hypothetical protein
LVSTEWIFHTLKHFHSTADGNMDAGSAFEMWSLGLGFHPLDEVLGGNRLDMSFKLASSLERVFGEIFQV